MVVWDHTEVWQSVTEGWLPLSRWDHVLKGGGEGNEDFVGDAGGQVGFDERQPDAWENGGVLGWKLGEDEG